MARGVKRIVTGSVLAAAAAVFMAGHVLSQRFLATLRPLNEPHVSIALSGGMLQAAFSSEAGPPGVPRTRFKWQDQRLAWLISDPPFSPKDVAAYGLLQINLKPVFYACTGTHNGARFGTGMVVAWLPAAVLAPFSAWALHSGVKRFRLHGPGRCSRCGYDRRGTAPGAACPECGTKPETASRV